MRMGTRRRMTVPSRDVSNPVSFPGGALKPTSPLWGGRRSERSDADPGGGKGENRTSLLPPPIRSPLRSISCASPQGGGGLHRGMTSPSRDVSIRGLPRWKDGRSKDRSVLVCNVRSFDHPPGRCPVLLTDVASAAGFQIRKRMCGFSTTPGRVGVSPPWLSARDRRPLARPSSCPQKPYLRGEVAAAPTEPRFMTRLSKGRWRPLSRRFGGRGQANGE